MRPLVMVLALALVVVGSLSTRPMAAFGAGGQESQGAYPIDELVRATTRTIQSAKLEIAQDAAQAVRGFIVGGAPNYVPQRRDEAFTNVGVFAHSLIDLAREKKATTVTAPMVKQVVAGICPLWPFCK